MKKILKYTGIGVIVTGLFVIVLGLSILFSPLLIIFGIFNYFDSLYFRKKYSEYLQTINGTKFFCYNNKKNSQEFIENNILPTLPPDIKIIFLDGRSPKTEYEQKFISKALYNIKDKKGFPYLLKIINGKLYDKSINNDFYNTLKQNKDLSQLREKINYFFQTV